ncbi:oxidoreductase [Candidatus Gracilibacteria bacterium]|nr:oxidoreductase [Candidatus Gracilibacteria bacterium]
MTPVAQNRSRCEIWTRVMGYHRPVSHFNIGKKSEHYSRQHFQEQASVNSDFCAKF